MAFCLTRDQENNLRSAFVSGKLDPFKLEKLPSSEARRAVLEKFVDPENAANINSLFESKLLLKNQITGYKTWVKSLIGVKPKIKRDLLTKIDRLKELSLLNPIEIKSFNEDLIRTRLGVNLTFEEAKKINNLAKVVEDFKEKTDPTKSDISLGRAKIDLIEYVNSLKPLNRRLVTNVAGIPRSIMASLDLSAPLNQGWGMISRKRFYTALGSMLKTVKSENNFKNLQAWIITHPDYETANKSGLRITEIGNNLNKREEEFMSNLVDRVPGISASQRAYVGFLNKLRMDSYSDLLRKAEISGENVEPGSPAAKDLANIVNSFTGGASVGKVEGAVPFLNALFFSPRKIKSTINMINPMTYLDKKTSKTARIEATRNLIGSLAVSASVIALHALLTGEEPEKDPTSSNFGKIRSGDTRMDVTGGNATYVNFLSRIILGRIKTNSGTSRKLGTGYGETSAFDIIAQFVRYKLSPNASFLVDAVTGANAIGEEKTITQSALDRFKPLFLESVIELLDSDAEGKFGFVLGGLFGAGLNTYSLDADWAKKTTKEMINFRDQVGDKKFKEASEKYNKEYDEWFVKVVEKQDYKNLSDEGKEKTIADAKKAIKKKILDEYGYDPTDEKPDTLEELKEKDVIEKLKPLQSMIDKAVKVIAKIDLVSDALASEGREGMSPEQRTRFDEIKQRINGLVGLIASRRKSKLLSPQRIDVLTDEVNRLMKEGNDLLTAPAPPEEPGQKTYKVVNNIGKNPKFSEVKPKDSVDTAIRNAAKEFNVPSELLFDISFAESTLDTTKQNNKSTAGGLFQFLDASWKQAMRELGLPEDTPKTDEVASARAAAMVISKGRLSWWDASKKDPENNQRWGDYYTDEELKLYDRRLKK
jgi:hypothetical protein